MTDNRALDGSTTDPYPGNSSKGGSFRRFILDPKASVKTYVSESLLDTNDPAHGENHKYSNQQDIEQGHHQGFQQQYPGSSPPYPQQTGPQWPNTAPLDQQVTQQQYPNSTSPFPQQTLPHRPLSAPLDQQANQAPRPHHIESDQGTFEISIRPTSQNHEIGSTQPQTNGFVAYSSSQNTAHGHNDLPQQNLQQQNTGYGAPFPQPPIVPELYPSQHQDFNYGAPHGQSPPPAPQVSPFQPQQTLLAPSPQPSPQISQIYPSHQSNQMPSPQPSQLAPQVYPNHQPANTPSVQRSLSPMQDMGVLSQSRYGPAPPPADSLNSSILAPRTYHRMVVDFETLKSVFYMAKAQAHHVDLGPVAARLKTLSREIWTLRFTRASEFDFSDSAHEQIITFWKAQFEQWSDVLEDLADPVQSKKDAANDLSNDYVHLAGLDAPKAALVAKPAVAKEAATAAKKPAAAAVAADGTVVKKVVKKVAAKPVAE